jgi:hypothetical protein
LRPAVSARFDELAELGLGANELFELFGLSDWLELDEYASGATP